jgi:hypothetical protein
MDLELIQKKYRVSRQEGMPVHEPLNQEIIGKYGTIYPYSKTQLGIQIRAGVLANRIARMKKWEIIQDADDLVTFLADPKDILFFCKYIRARRRRVLSPEHRLKAIKNLKGITA